VIGHPRLSVGFLCVSWSSGFDVSRQVLSPKGRLRFSAETSPNYLIEPTLDEESKVSVYIGSIDSSTFFQTNNRFQAKLPLSAQGNFEHISEARSTLNITVQSYFHLATLP